MSVFKAFRLEKHSMIKVESYKLDNENFAGKTRRPCLINLSIFICLFLKTAVKILPILFWNRAQRNATDHLGEPHVCENYLSSWLLATSPSRVFWDFAIPSIFFSKCYLWKYQKKNRNFIIRGHFWDGCSGFLTES